MAIDDFGLSADGYTAPRQADFLTAIRARFNSALIALGFTELPDYERDTYVGNVTEIMSYMLGQLSEGNQAVYDARSVANATGLQLGNLALLVGVTRDPATYGTVTLTCTGTNGTVITQGKIAEGGGDDGRARWVITADATIGDTVSGEVDVVARADTKGQIVASVNQIDAIVTPIAGWDTVANAAAADPGDERETDSELRSRRQRALQAAGATAANAILSALLGLDAVESAVVVDNKTAVAVTADGITVDPYAVACVVAPDSITADEKALVVQAIYDHLGAGTATSGAETATVTKRDGRSEIINYYLAADELFTVNYVLEMEAGFVTADVEETLGAAVLDYSLTLAVGETVYPTPLQAIAAAIDGIANVTTLLIDGGPAPATFTALQQPTLTVPIGVS